MMRETETERDRERQREETERGRQRDRENDAAEVAKGGLKSLFKVKNFSLPTIH